MSRKHRENVIGDGMNAEMLEKDKLKVIRLMMMMTTIRLMSLERKAERCDQPDRVPSSEARYMG